MTNSAEIATPSSSTIPWINLELNPTASTSMGGPAFFQYDPSRHDGLEPPDGYVFGECKPLGVGYFSIESLQAYRLLSDRVVWRESTHCKRYTHLSGNGGCFSFCQSQAHQLRLDDALSSWDAASTKRAFLAARLAGPGPYILVAKTEMEKYLGRSLALKYRTSETGLSYFKMDDVIGSDGGKASAYSPSIQWIDLEPGSNHARTSDGKPAFIERKARPSLRPPFGYVYGDSSAVLGEGFYSYETREAYRILIHRNTGRETRARNHAKRAACTEKKAFLRSRLDSSGPAAPISWTAIRNQGGHPNRSYPSYWSPTTSDDGMFFLSIGDLIGSDGGHDGSG